MIRSMILFVGCILIIFGLVDCLSPDEYKKYVKENGAPRYIYLTQICAYISLACFVYGLILRIIEIMRNKKYLFFKIAALRKHLILRRFYVSMQPFLLTVNSTVTSGYWYLFFTSRDSIVTRMPGTDNEPNTFINLCHHFVPWIVTLIEALAVRARHTIATSVVVVVFAMLYYTLICVYHMRSNKWPYRFFYGSSYVKILLLVGIFAMAGFIIAFVILKVYELVCKRYFNEQKRHVQDA